MLSEDEAIAFIHEMSTAPIGIPEEWFQIAIALQPSNQLIGDIGIHVGEHDTTTVEMNLISSEEVAFKDEYCVEQTFELRKKDWLLHTFKTAFG